MMVKTKKKKCDFCNKTFIMAHKRARFCSKKCRGRWREKEKIDYITRVCSVCGKEYLSHKRNKKSKFCSSKCMVTVLKPWEKNIGRKTGSYKKCSNCGKEVYIKPCRLRFKNHFCSRKCQIELSKKEAYRDTCVVCGKTYYCQPSQKDYRNRKTCSRKCFGEYASMEAAKKRKENGFSKHQIDRCIRYSKKAQKWREDIFKRDDYTCQECKVKGGYLEAHHIKPFAYFPKLRFELSNGLTLCRKCHDKTKISYVKLREKYGEEIQKSLLVV